MTTPKPRPSAPSIEYKLLSSSKRAVRIKILDDATRDLTADERLKFLGELYLSLLEAFDSTITTHPDRAKVLATIRRLPGSGNSFRKAGS